MILNAVVDFLGELLDRATLFVYDHWPALVVLAIAAAVSKRFRIPARVVDGWASIAARPIVPYAIIGALSLAWSAGAAAFHGLPLPDAHDDFAYLLTGELFAHGHASAATHPLWQHFESIHILQIPRYAGKYQPGPGIVLAIGSLLFRTPIAGVWLCIAAAGLATLWMLRACVPPSWSLLGGALFAIHPTIFDWSHSYHGGSLATTGGALAIGGARRFVTSPSAAAGVAMGVGASMLAASRPFEGAVLFGLIAIAVAVTFRSAARTALAFAVVAGLAGLGLLLAYNRSITGSFLRMPYAAYESQYDPVPNFLWQGLGPVPQYRSAEFASFYRFCVRYFQRLHEPGGRVAEFAKKIDVMRRALIGDPGGLDLVLYVPLLAIPIVMRDRIARAALAALLIFSGSTLLIVWWMQLHYLAPAAALAALLFIVLLRSNFLPPAFVCAVILVFVATAATGWIRYARSAERGTEVVRGRMAEALIRRGGKHVILVPQNVFDYVHNGYGIDRQPVVWARSLGPLEDERLMNYFRDRSVWRVDAAQRDRLVAVRTR